MKMASYMSVLISVLSFFSLDFILQLVTPVVLERLKAKVPESLSITHVFSLTVTFN